MGFNCETLNIQPIGLAVKTKRRNFAMARNAGLPMLKRYCHGVALAA